MSSKFILTIFLLSLLFGCARSPRSSSNSSVIKPITPDARLLTITDVITPFFEKMGPPKPMDWLATYREPGQTFKQYVEVSPAPPSPDRRVIYVLPLGKMSAGNTRVIEITAGYLQIFYGLDVKLLPAKTLKRPARVSDFRINPVTKAEQIRTGYLLDEFLPPLAPSDAAVLMAFTNEDLFPDASMSFVFGQANREKRTAVWSLSRLDDHASPQGFLRRTIKIAVHETGHLFAIRHCTKYVCVMSGTNHLQETDSHPIDACPECTAKICWLLRLDPVERYNKLAEYCRRNGLTSESQTFLKKAQALAAAYEQK